MTTAQDMYLHFSATASSYRQVRTTDPEIILFIAEILKDREEIKAADIGCGTGRYDLLLFEHLKNLHLTCIDANENMLAQASSYLQENQISNFEVVKSQASKLPLEAHSMDSILTFNAIHHFDFAQFINECWNALKKDGRIFIYTRLRSQNANNIWGSYFPYFSEKETRLYEFNEIEAYIQDNPLLEMETSKSFRFKRNSTLDRLVDQAKAKHYSTFSLYSENEFSESLNIFQANIRKNFPNTNQVEWMDENILLVLKPN